MASTGDLAINPLKVGVIVLTIGTALIHLLPRPPGLPALYSQRAGVSYAPRGPDFADTPHLTVLDT